MDWPTFWAPNLVQWIVGGSITALVSAIVGLTARYLLKRWWSQWGQPWVEQKLGEQIAAANEAAKESREAKRTVLKLVDAGGTVVTALPERDEAVDYLMDTNSRLVAQLVIQAAKHPEDFDSPTAPRPELPPGLLVPAHVGGEDPTTVSGRHRLHRAHADAQTDFDARGGLS